MADKIGAYGRSGVDISSARNRQLSKTPTAEDTQAQKRPQQAGDAVDFSDTVSNLKRIESQLKQTPEVDAERVAEVRARVESGEYEVDAKSVASKLARLEQDLS